MAFTSSFLCAACDRRWEEHETFFESEETRRRGGRPYGMGVAGGLRPLPDPIPAFFPPFALSSATQWQLQGFLQLGGEGVSVPWALTRTCPHLSSHSCQAWLLPLIRRTASQLLPPSPFSRTLLRLVTLIQGCPRESPFWGLALGFAPCLSSLLREPKLPRRRCKDSHALALWGWWVRSPFGRPQTHAQSSCSQGQR